MLTAQSQSVNSWASKKYVDMGMKNVRAATISNKCFLLVINHEFSNPFHSKWKCIVGAGLLFSIESRIGVNSIALPGQDVAY